MLNLSTTRPRSWEVSKGSSMQMRCLSFPTRLVQSFMCLLKEVPHGLRKTTCQSNLCSTYGIWKNANIALLLQCSIVHDSLIG
jgi:hypothetical protein